VVCKKYPKLTNIITPVVGLITLVGYFEMVILHNEPEEGMLFFILFGIMSLIFVFLLKYYWIIEVLN